MILCVGFSFGMHDLLYDDVAFCRFVREDSFSSFGLHEFCCCMLLQDCEVGLWHDHNVAFCRFVKGGYSSPLGCMICCIFLSGL